MTEPQPELEDHDVAENAALVTADTSSAEQDKLAKAQTEIASLKDQVLRALAEAENTRRRMQKEREDTAKYAVANFAKEMLNVSDNFQRALDATPKDTNDTALKNLIAGIEATERQLQAALERFGIKKIEPLGQVFDPNFHRVMMEVDDPDQPAGTVVQVMQPGYAIHDRLLREALVAVAKDSGKPPAQHQVDTSA
jgi:molecular chaperone GrpE